MVEAVIFDMYETLITLFDSPQYFGSHIAADAGIPEKEFYEIWDPIEDDMSIGKITLEEVIEKILRAFGRFTQERFQMIVDKRVASKAENFNHLHKEILPMLSQLKEHGIRIGLISNCFSEEADAIRKSILFPYFDVVCLSYEEGIQKPNPMIFQRCSSCLGVSPKDCLYVGDGGSHELEAAKAAGMHPYQAVWYLKDGTKQPCKRLPEFESLETPLQLIEIITEGEFIQ